MQQTIVVTSIYSEFWGTEEFKKSLKRCGIRSYNAFKGTKFTGNGDIIKMLYNAYKELKDVYKYIIYSDGADTMFLHCFEPTEDCVIYSVEQAIWPPLDYLRGLWDEHYKDKKYPGYWRYLNGGNYCGPSELIVEFFERYGLDKLSGDVNGQFEQAEAFIKASKDGFPIRLDTNCEYFQTTAFLPEFFSEADNIFSHNNHGLYNSVTKTYPHILHGNGRSDMDVLYRTFRSYGLKCE